MAKTEPIELEALVTEALPNAMFRLEIEMGETKHEILGHISGKCAVITSASRPATMSPSK
ncbi:hypothetical protein LCGC14_0275010 [marine sediment metagenome]|uniref:Translation initiation factor IF-1 n=1 Tax=marine sediment metagenome TaxID=412755 RepID=A0A0F9X326_9ZZZZ